MALDPTLVWTSCFTLDEIYREKQIGNNLGALGLAVVTFSVLLLSAAGMYALMSFTVNQRRREIGIRSALGAQPRRLLAGIFRRALRQLGRRRFRRRPGGVPCRPLRADRAGGWLEHSSRHPRRRGAHDRDRSSRGVRTGPSWTPGRADGGFAQPLDHADPTVTLGVTFALLRADTRQVLLGHAPLPG